MTQEWKTDNCSSTNSTMVNTLVWLSISLHRDFEDHFYITEAKNLLWYLVCFRLNEIKVFVKSGALLSRRATLKNRSISAVSRSELKFDSAKLIRIQTWFIEDVSYFCWGSLANWGENAFVGTRIFLCIIFEIIIKNILLIYLHWYIYIYMIISIKISERDYIC